MKKTFILIIALLPFVGFGQATLSDQALQYLSGHPVEKAYLQFDKPYYAAGDTIYFKGYVTRGEHHRLTDLSEVLHVDLINANGKIDQSIKLHLDSGITWGDFALPDSLPKGNYRVRAYTQWMRNNGDVYFFDKIIPVGSLRTAKVPESLVKQALPPNLKPDIQFFPEGGKPITGIPAKMAFKAVAPDGLGIDFKGEIVDNDNKEVASFSAVHLGMGYFYFTPTEGKTYTAKINYSNGMTDVVVLPKQEPNGITLSVNNDSLPNAAILIKASRGYYRLNKDKNYTLVVYSQGTVTTVKCRLDSTEIKLNVLKRKLHTGVATVTLFSAENEPLCERLFFIQNYDQLSLAITGDKETYAKREKVNIKLNALNRKGSAADGHFSVSVINESNVPDDQNYRANILSYLLLTSDIKGNIEQPGYYFADTSMEARTDLDILMLTQGYRRFTWKQVLDTTKRPLEYLPEKGIAIEGEVKSVFNKPVANGTVTLISSIGGPILSAVTDAKGMFSFSNLLFTDTAHFVLSAVNAKGKNSTKIDYFDKPASPPVTPMLQSFVQSVSDTAMASYVGSDRLQQREILNYGKSKGIMLKQVNIRDKKLDNQYRTASLAGAGNADQVMHADEIGQIQGPLSTSLDGRLRGIVFAGHNPIHKIPYLKTGLGGPMLVIIDGTEVPADDLNFLTASQVETVEVLKYANASIYGASGGNGVLIITTKQGGGLAAKDIVSIGVLPIAPMGFYKAKEFYSPKYDNGSWIGKQKDLRSTIYWKPEIKTDKDGNASIEYYNADGTGTYKLVVEGIDNNGNIGRQVYRYKVE